jgi:hypothetical protein
MDERAQAIALANRLLDEPNFDPVPGELPT